MALADAKILETTLTPGDGETIVRLLISDGSPKDEPATATIEIQITARIGAAASPMLGHAQRETIQIAQDVLHRLRVTAHQAAETAIRSLRS